MGAVLSHKERATATWRSGGRDYERVSEGVSDALAYLVVGSKFRTSAHVKPALRRIPKARKWM